MTATLNGPLEGTWSGSRPLSFLSSTCVLSPVSRASASRAGVSVTALLSLEFVHVPCGTRSRAALTHGSAATSSNSPSFMRAVKRRWSDVSTSPSLKVSVCVWIACPAASGTELR